MENGVLITETAQVRVRQRSMPERRAGQSVVTLLRSILIDRRRIRAAVRARFAVDVPVVMSDSFGRPRRWGIIDVAIGVSGCCPSRTSAAPPTPMAGS
jgi:F420-0:gamma-glutamyl ligase